MNTVYIVNCVVLTDRSASLAESLPVEWVPGMSIIGRMHTP